MVIAVITHTDMDGAGAAGLYLYLTNQPEHRLFFTEPYLLDKTLSKVSMARYEKIIISDIGINPAVYARVLEYIDLLRKNSTPIYWYDHHVWEEKWINEIRERGVELFIDRSTCATGVVAKYVEPKRDHVDMEFLEEVVRGVCAGDLWRFDHWRGGYYLRLVRRKDENSWRKHVIKTIADGTAWTSEFEEKVLENLEQELRQLSSSINIVEKTINNLRIVVAESSEDVENSFLAAYLIGRYNADIAVLASKDGKLSFRSRRVNVREVALRLSGGGHIYASGAKIEIPLFTRLLGRISTKAVLAYIVDQVVKAVNDIPEEILKLPS